MTSAQPSLTAPRRVLIIKPSSLGDVVTAVPVLRGLRRTFPHVHITWLVAKSCAELIAHDPDLNEILLFDRKLLGQAWRSPAAAKALRQLVSTLRNGQFDWVIDLQGLLRSGLLTAATRAPVRCGFDDAREGAPGFYTHRVAAVGPHTVDQNIELARFLNVDARPVDLSLAVAPAAGQFARDFLGAHTLTQKGYLVCVPPTRWPTKVYPVRHWRTVLAQLACRIPVVLIGSPAERDLCHQVAQGLPGQIINAAGQTSVAQMVALIASAAGVICSDSSANFIGPALGVSVVTLIGPTLLNRTGPYLPGPHVTATPIVAQVPCQGCRRRRCSHTTCMESIAPARVIDAANKTFSLQQSAE